LLNSWPPLTGRNNCGLVKKISYLGRESGDFSTPEPLQQACLTWKNTLLAYSEYACLFRQVAPMVHVRCLAGASSWGQAKVIPTGERSKGRDWNPEKSAKNLLWW